MSAENGAELTQQVDTPPTRYYRASGYSCNTWGRSSVGRAPALQAGGHRFDPGRLHYHNRLT